MQCKHVKKAWRETAEANNPVAADATSFAMLEDQRRWLEIRELCRSHHISH